MSSGTLLNQIRQFVSEPASILRVLGTGAPQTASFFILYILVNALIAKPMGECVMYTLVKTSLLSL